MSTGLGAAIAALFGAILGSFLNVVIHRLPRGESLAKPASRCPECETPIKPYDNIPIVSWLVLRGRCRNCGARISPRYPLVEALTAVLFAAVVLRFGADEDVWLGFAFVLILIPVTFIDLDLRLIPNKITVPGAVVGLVLVAVFQTDDLLEHVIAGIAAFMFLFLAALAYPAGMGMGDVKLAGVMGVFLGLSVVPALLLGFLTGSLVGVAILARHGAAGRKRGVPFAPFLALGGLVALLAGPELVDLYVENFL